MKYWDFLIYYVPFIVSIFIIGYLVRNELFALLIAILAALIFTVALVIDCINNVTKEVVEYMNKNICYDKCSIKAIDSDGDELEVKSIKEDANTAI